MLSPHRADWLGQMIFPHEAALRAWLARRPLSASMDIDDVVQETYAILASLDTVDHIRNPRTYMFETAKSVVLQNLRRARVVTIDALAESGAMELPSDAPSPERIALARQELGRVAAMITELPPRCREVFLLRKVRGLSQREVAHMLSLSESTVEKHMVKALQLLASAIGRSGKRSAEASKGRDYIESPFPRCAARKRDDH